MVLIGYSGHSLVVSGILNKLNRRVLAYCDTEEKNYNPLGLSYLGSEMDPAVTPTIKSGDFFISIGDNSIRRKVATHLANLYKYPTTIIDPTAIIDHTVYVSDKGVMVGTGVVVNPFSRIADGAIVNTGAIVEHECVIESFAHVGPGAVLCGNVTIGPGSFIGAAAVIRQNISIGKNAIVGAGSVVVKDVPDDECVIGVPAISYKK